MKEVSCRAFDALDGAVRRGFLSPQDLLEGVGYSIEHLRNKHERMEWSAYCRLTRNARARLSPTDFEELGVAFTTSSSFRVIIIIARLLFRPTRFLHWMQSMEREGNQMFTCVHSVTSTPSEDHFSLTLTIDEELEDCPEFFYITKGTIRALPQLLGAHNSTMECTIGERQATYEMYVPPREGVIRRLRRVLASPYRAAEAAGALQEAHEVLQLRYTELDTARTTLDEQARQLRAAHVVNENIQHSLNLDNTLNAVIESLCAVLNLDGAEIRIELESEQDSVSEKRLFGTKNAQEPIRREIVAREQAIGTLTLWPTVASEPELETILDFVLPNILIAIENALNYDALGRYRDRLEQRVQERTIELELARDELAISLGDLELAQSARERIFENINHEIRTPLAIVQLASEEAREAIGNAQPKLAGQRLAAIDKAVERLLRLVDGLLLLAASDENKIGLHMEPIELGELINSEVEAWQPLARKNAIALSFVSPQVDRELALDPRAIAGVIGNLISNAIKFTPDGGSVEVSLDARGDSVVVSVLDTGVGMSKEFAERAFERFTQGAEAVRSLGSGSGSGIGLSIVREVVEAHGGSAYAEPNPKGGSCISFTLPTAPVLGVDPTVSPAPHRRNAQAVARYGPISEMEDELDDNTEDANGAFRHCVLIAEDQATLRNVMIRCLSPHYRVLSAVDGEQALALAKEHLPDLLVTDISMPQMDGLELTRQFTEIPNNRAARVLLVTSDSALRTRLDAFEAGAVDFITKPFHKQELLARVRAQLSIRDIALQLLEVEKVAAMGILGAGLAHEIRNPLNAVINAIKPLRRALPPDAKVAGSKADILLALIERGAGKMQDISRSIGQLENSSELTLETALMSAMIAGAISSLPDFPGDRVSVECEPGLAVRCAPSLIQQVLANILGNALQSTGPAGTFEIKARERDGDAIVQISNDGPAIERSQRERVFQPFFTTKAPGKGTGLGLAISRRAVQRHGGSLCVLDTPRGCTFELRLSTSGVI